MLEFGRFAIGDAKFPLFPDSLRLVIIFDFAGFAVGRHMRFLLSPVSSRLEPF